MKLTAKHIEYAVACSFDFRQNNIVPNVSWGAGLHECDLLIIKRSKWATEVEIKISKSDLKADFNKKHKHESEKIRELFYAIPDYLYEECKDLIPEHAGILTVDGYLVTCRKRDAKPNPSSRKLTDDEIKNILRLGNMRTWSMRRRSLQNEGVISKPAPRRDTKTARRLADMSVGISNILYFLKDKNYDDPDLKREIRYLEKLIK